MVLNDQVIRAAKSGTLWDSSLKGFGLRTGKQSKTFIVLVASGRRKRIGRYPLLSLADARATARKILAEKTLGTIVPRHTAYEDALELFIEDCATRLRPLTIRLYKQHLKRFRFGRKSVGDISGNDILKVLKALTPSNKEHAFRIARTFFTWCIHNHIIDRSPMEKLEPPPLGKARERVLTDQELKKVYTAAERRSNPLERLVWLLIRTGQRIGEIRHLQWEYIQADRITFPGDITKNGQTHTFPISKETADTIATFPRVDDSKYVFPAARSHVRGKPTTVIVPTAKTNQDFATACGTSGWTFHDLRRTFATGLQKLGVRLEVTEALLNHVSGSRAGIVGVYQRHTFFPEMQHAIATWDAKLAHL